MVKHVQNEDLFSTWSVNETGSWLLAQSAAITVGSDAGELFGIEETSGQDNNRIDVKGDITASDPFGTEAIHLAGTFTELHIFKSATLKADTGISATGGGEVIRNEGRIEAGTGIHASDAERITNTGDILSSIGISTGNDSTIVNSGNISTTAVGILTEGNTTIRNLDGGLIKTAGTAIEITTTGVSTITNHGEIEGDISDGLGSVTIVNRGSIKGNLDLGDSPDIFDTRGGVFQGTVNGGEYSDVYKISKSNVMIVEGVGHGEDDKVFSSASYMLGENIEHLILTGGKNIAGHGGSDHNFLTGNSGNNRLYGNAGEDLMKGGRGKDLLFGGVDGDIFVFDKNSDREIVADFEDGFDLIKSSFGATDSKLDNLLKHHMEQKGDDVVISYGDDQLIIRNMDVNNISSADFLG